MFVHLSLQVYKHVQIWVYPFCVVVQISLYLIGIFDTRFFSEKVRWR